MQIIGDPDRDYPEIDDAAPGDDDTNGLTGLGASPPARHRKTRKKVKDATAHHYKSNNDLLQELRLPTGHRTQQRGDAFNT